MERTQTERTKEIDKYFEFDESYYPKSGMKARRIKRKYRAFCLDCNSNNCQVIEEIEEVAIPPTTKVVGILTKKL